MTDTSWIEGKQIIKKQTNEAKAKLHEIKHLALKKLLEIVLKYFTSLQTRV